MAMQNDAFAKRDHDRVAMNLHTIARPNFDVPVQFDMGVKMLSALLDLDPAGRVERFG